MKSPFILENETEYKNWRQTKLELYPLNINKFSIPLDINVSTGTYTSCFNLPNLIK